MTDKYKDAPLNRYAAHVREWFGADCRLHQLHIQSRLIAESISPKERDDIVADRVRQYAALLTVLAEPIDESTSLCGDVSVALVEHVPLVIGGHSFWRMAVVYACENGNGACIAASAMLGNPDVRTCHGIARRLGLSLAYDIASEFDSAFSSIESLCTHRGIDIANEFNQSLECVGHREYVATGASLYSGRAVTAVAPAEFRDLSALIRRRSGV